MRPAFFTLLLLLAPLFAFSYPPHAEVAAHNDNDTFVGSLLNSSCLNESNPNYDNPIKCAEMELLTVYPSVDSRVSADFPARAIWRYAYSATSQDTTQEGPCGYTDHLYKTFTSAESSAGLISFFRGSEYPIYNVTWSPIDIPVPEDMLQLTDGDNLTMSLQGRIVFFYTLTDNTWDCDANCSCIPYATSWSYNITRDFESNLTYEVEGGALLHFLSKPVLHEQWAKDSQFEDLVFSKRKFYYSSLSLGSNEMGNATFYTFDIVNVSNNSFNVWGIVSHPVSNFTNLDEKEMKEKTIPVPIETRNDTHVYIYIFNSSYQFLGPHIITLDMSDHFGNNFSKTFNITNRLLTSGNAIAENGETNITDSSLYRPSVKFGEKTSSLLVANVSLIGAFVLLFVFLRK